MAMNKTQRILFLCIGAAVFIGLVYGYKKHNEMKSANDIPTMESTPSVMEEGQAKEDDTSLPTDDDPLKTPTGEVHPDDHTSDGQAHHEHVPHDNPSTTPAAECCICFDVINTERVGATLEQMPCGHRNHMHKKCLLELKATGGIYCPLCRKPLREVMNLFFTVGAAIGTKSPK